MPSARRFSARGSPPSRASLRLARAFPLASARGDQGETAESELPAMATDDEALNPTAGSAGLNEEVQSVSIGVSSGRSGAQESGREGVAGVTAGGFGLGSDRSEVRYSIHPPIIWGMAVDCKGCW